MGRNNERLSAESTTMEENDNNYKENKISQSSLDACNHKIRTKKVTYPSGA
jgi:hypothetical protein